jgi:hypothetical protein
MRNTWALSWLWGPIRKALGGSPSLALRAIYIDNALALIYYVYARDGIEGCYLLVFGRQDAALVLFMSRCADRGWSMVDVRSMVWVDANGKTRQSIIRGSGSLIGATLSTVEADIAALSNAVVLRSWEGAENVPGGTATAAVFQSVADWAQLLYAASDGTEVYVTIPAPKSTIFLSDQETVDVAALTSLNADVASVVVTASGLHAATYLGGVRRSRLKEYQ